MGRIFAFIILLVTLVLLADYAITMAAEQRVEDEVSATLGTPTDVELNGWPVSLRILTGVVPQAVISAERVPLPEGQGRLTRLEIVLSQVEVPPSLPVTTIQVASSRFRAGIDQNDLRTLVPSHDIIQDVQLLGDGIRVVGPGGLSVDAAVSARDGAVVLQADTGLPGVGLLELSVPVNHLPAGASLDDVRVERGELVLAGPVDVNRLMEEINHMRAAR